MKKGEDFVGVAIVFFCHDGNGEFLMSLRSQNCRDEHGKWDPGGGGLEFGDTVEGTLRQEIKEECCTDILDYEFLGYRDIHREHDGKKTHWIGLDFLVHVDRSKVQNGEPHKFLELKWSKIDELPQPLHSQFPKFFEMYEKQIRAKA